MIDRYLDGKEHLFSKTGAQLATEGITTKRAIQKPQG